VFLSIYKITEKKEEFYSLLVFKDISARHSGKYTCYASNAAAKVNYTAELQVRGEWEGWDGKGSLERIRDSVLRIPGSIWAGMRCDGIGWLYVCVCLLKRCAAVSK